MVLQHRIPGEVTATISPLFMRLLITVIADVPPHFCSPCPGQPISHKLVSNWPIQTRNNPYTINVVLWWKNTTQDYHEFYFTVLFGVESEGILLNWLARIMQAGRNMFILPLVVSGSVG